MVGCLLVHRDPEFAPDIILKIVIVTIQVIFGDIGENSNIRPECFDIIQLEAADLCYIQWLRIFGHLPGKGVTNITHQCTIKAGFFTDMKGQCCCRGLSITPGDSDDLAVAFETVSQFDLADDGNSFCPDLFYQFILFWYAGAFHHFISSEDSFLVMMTFLEADTCLLQFVTIIFFQRTSIRKECIIPLLLCE